MTGLTFPDLSASPILWVTSALAALGVGYIAGLLHFHSLRIVARRLTAGDWSAVFLQLGRIMALGGLLWFFALGGAHLLLAAAGGILLARSRVLARSRADE